MHTDQRAWTPNELVILERLLGKVSATTIAKKLKRTEASVVMKIKAWGTLGASARDTPCVTSKPAWEKTITKFKDGLRTVGFAIGYKERTVTMETVTTFTDSMKKTSCIL